MGAEIDPAEKPPSNAKGGVTRREDDGYDLPAQTWGGWAWEIARTWGPAILAVLFIRTFIFEPFRIPSGSMVPTLLIGDHVLVAKSSYGVWAPSTGVEVPFLDYAFIAGRFELFDLGDPERGDIIVFRYPRDERMNYIKRVVGIPGDKLRVQDNHIFVNGAEFPVEDRRIYEWLDDTCRRHAAKLHAEDLGTVEHAMLTSNGLGGMLADTREFEVPEGHVFVMGDNRDNSEDSRRWGFVRFDQIKGKAHFVWLSWDRCNENGSIRTNRFFRGLYDSADP